MDGAGIMVPDKENESVIQEIRHFIAGRCWNHDFIQQKLKRRTQNQEKSCTTVPEVVYRCNRTGENRPQTLTFADVSFRISCKSVCLSIDFSVMFIYRI